MICKACGTDKRDEDFPFTYKRKPDGDYRRDVSGKMPRSGVCKECKNKSCSEWRKNNSTRKFAEGANSEVQLRPPKGRFDYIDPS